MDFDGLAQAIQAKVDAGDESNIRTYTKWINSKLIGIKPKVVVTNLVQDLRDGHVLLSLLEVLLKKKIRRQKGKLKFHKINNVETVLSTLQGAGLDLHGITSSAAIVDGNYTSTLGLVWQVILFFLQVPEVQFEETDSPKKTAKTKKLKKTGSQADIINRHLIKWAQELLKRFHDVVTVNDITKSWRDGLAFLYILFVFKPNDVDIEKARKMQVRERLDYAFTVAEKDFNVPRLLEPSDVDKDSVDKKSMLMYLSSLYEALRNLKPADVRPDGHSARLHYGDEVIETTTISTNEIVINYKILYYEIITMVKRIEANMETIKKEEPSQKTARLLDENQQRIAQLQPKISQLNDMSAQMEGADGVDTNEHTQLKKELADFNSRWATVTEQTTEEEKRQPEIKGERTIYTLTTTVIEGGHSARVHFGDEVIDITTVSTNEIMLKYKILYYEIIIRMKLIEANAEIIRTEEPSQKTALLLEENKQRIAQLQSKVSQLNEMNGQMKGLHGVDVKEFAETKSELADFNSRWTTVTEQIIKEEKRQPPIAGETVHKKVTLRIGDQVIEILTVSTNDIVIKYKVLYYEILITLLKIIEADMAKIQAEEPSEENALLLKQNKERMARLEPKVANLKEMFGQMEGADGVDAKEFAEIKSESADFDLRFSTVIEQIAKESKRQPPIYMQSTIIHHGSKEFVIKTISTNTIVMEYKILYYQIVTRLKTIEENIAQIKAAPPTSTTAIMLKENQREMDELQIQIKQLQGMSEKMEGADGVDPEEFSEIQSEMKEFNSRWTLATTEIEAEQQRVSNSLESDQKQKKALNDWRKKCEGIGEWMDSVEDKLEVMETRKLSVDPMTLKQQMNECDRLQEKIASDEQPRSTFELGAKITSDSSLSPELSAKIRSNMSDMKSVVKTLADRARAAKLRYKNASEKIESYKKQRLVKLQMVYGDLDRRIDSLQDKSERIGQMEGDPVTVRRKETEIELLVSDIQVFQPQFDDYRQATWEITEDISTNRTERETIQKQVSSLEERWGALIRSVYSRSEAAKSLISKLPQGGVLEELIILENLRHDYKVDWGAHQDLFGAPDEDDKGDRDIKIQRERLMVRWKRECREVEEGLSVVEKENKELEDIADDPSKIAMQKAKLKVILTSLNSVEKEYNDLPAYAKVLLEDPRLTQEDREKINTDLDSYTTRYEALRRIVSEKEERMQKYLSSKPSVVVTENYATERKKEPIVPWITAESAVVEESAIDDYDIFGSEKKDIQTFTENREEYVIIITWIITNERRLQQLRNDKSGDEEALRRRRIIIEEIITEITIYRTRLHKLIEKNKELLDKDSLPPEERDKLLKETRALEIRLDKLDDQRKEQEKIFDSEKEDVQAFTESLDEYEIIITWIITSERRLQQLRNDKSGDNEALRRRRIIIEEIITEITIYRTRLLKLIEKNKELLDKDSLPPEERNKLLKETRALEIRLDELDNQRKEQEKTLDVQFQSNTTKYNDWQAKADDLDKWLVTIKTELKSVEVPTIDDNEREKQKKYLDDFAKQKQEGADRVDYVVTSGRQLIEEGVIPADKREKVEIELESFPGTWDNIVETAEESRKTVDSGKKDVQTFTESYEEYETIITWIITSERRLQQLRDDKSVDEEALRRRRIIIEEIIYEITIYRTRLHKLIEKNKELLNKDSLPPEERDKLLKETRALEIRLEELDNQRKEQEKTLDVQFQTNTTKYNDWQTKADDLDKWLVTIKTELKSVEVPTIDDNEREKQKKYLDDFAKQKQDGADRVDYVVTSGRQLVEEGVIPADKREKVEIELESFPGTWDNIVETAEESRKTVDSGKKDVQTFTESYEEYETIITWIITSERRLQQLRDDKSVDEEALRRRRIIIEEIIYEITIYRTRLHKLIEKNKELLNKDSLPPEERDKLLKETRALEIRLEELDNQRKEQEKTLDVQFQANTTKYNDWQAKADDLDKWLVTIKTELKSVEVPTIDDNEREKQKKYLDDFAKQKQDGADRVDYVVTSGRHLVEEGVIPADKREKVEIELESFPGTWDNIVETAEESRKTLDSGKKDVQTFIESREECEIINSWIITSERRLQQLKDDKSVDEEALRRRRTIIEEIIYEITIYRTRLQKLIERNKELLDKDSLPAEEREKLLKETRALEIRLEELDNQRKEQEKTLDKDIKNVERYEEWQIKADDLDTWFVENKEKIESFDVPNSDVSEREKQKQFFIDFYKRKPAQNKKVNDVVISGKQLIDENILQTEKREKVEFVLQTFPDTWSNLVDKADESRENTNASLQDVVVLNKWRESYKVHLLWLENAQEKRQQREEVGYDLDKLKKERRKLEGDIKEMNKYETRITPFITGGIVISQSKFIDGDDAEDVGENSKSLKERFEKLKTEETDRKRSLDETIQWLTEYKDYRIEADSLNVMLDDCQTKLEACEKPTSSKAERDKQAAFLKKFVRENPQNDKRVETSVQLGNKLADQPSVSDDKREEIKEETMKTEESWRILVLKVEELQKIVNSGIQNITELSDWRKEYITVIKWIETTEKNLKSQGEPGTDLKDLSAKCIDLEVMVNVLSTYETRVVLLLEKGEQLSKEPSIEENDRTQTETDTKSLRERWDTLKKDEEEQKKRYDEQKTNVEDYRDWRDEVADVKPWLEDTKSKLDECKRPTSDLNVRKKQAEFLKVFIDDKEKNQGRVDSVVDGGNRLLKENPAAQQEREKINEEVENCEKSWKTISLEVNEVEKSVSSGEQDITQLREWHKSCRDVTRSLVNAKEKVRDLGKRGGDPGKIEIQQEQFELISKEINSSGNQIDVISQKADYLINISTIDAKDKAKVRSDMDNLNNSLKNYKNQEATTKASMDDNLGKLQRFNHWQVEITDTNKWLGGLQETVEIAEKRTQDPQVRQKHTESLKLMLDSKEENQKRVDNVVRTGDELVKNNQVPKDKQGQVKSDVKDLNDSWNSTLLRGENEYRVITSYVEPPKIGKKEVEKTEGAFQDIDDLFKEQPGIPVTVDYVEWKRNVEELERVLDQHDGKLDPKSDIEKEYSNLERLARETKDSGKILNDWKPKLTEIHTSGEALINSGQLSPVQQDDVREKISSLDEKTSRVNNAVVVVRMKVHDAALDYFNDTLNQCSVNVAKMYETAKSLRPPANKLPGVRIQHASLTTLERRIEEDEGKLEDIKEKVDKMINAEVLPRDGFAGTLINRCEEVRKEQQEVKKAITEAKPKLDRALLTQYNRTEKDVTKWLKQCESKEKDVNVDNVKDLDQTYTQCVKLKQAKVLFDKGEPKYITLGEVHKEAVEGEILTGKKATVAEEKLESLTTRHDELQKRLNEKEQSLHPSLSHSMDEIVNSVEEKVKEGESWVELEVPADNFSDAKEQQDRMKERELIIKGQQTDILEDLRRVDQITTSNVLPEKERSAMHRRIHDLKQRHTSTIQAAKDKSQKIRLIYISLLRPEMEKRKAWLLDHEGSTGPATDTNFKDFNEFKEKYDHDQDFKKELDDNNVEVLLNEAENIEDVEPGFKDELKELDQRWKTIHDAHEEKSTTYENIMIHWQEFREHQLAILNWVDEKDNQVSANKNQINYADEDEVTEQMKQLKIIKDEAEAQGESQQTKLNEAGEKLISHLGKDSPAAEEITKQMHEVDSCRKDFIVGIEQRLEKIEAGERKTRELYTDMDNVSTWLDSTDTLMDTYDDKKPQGEGEREDSDVVEDVDVENKGEVKEEKVHVVEELLANRKQISEKQESLDKVVKSVKDLDDELDEDAKKVAEGQVNVLQGRWDTVTKRMDTFFSREIPEMEIAEIKAERLDEDSLDETDLNSVVSMEEWRSKVRKVNLLLKYLERLASSNADVKRDYPNIRILASNTKEATRSINSYCKPRMEVVTVLGQNIVKSHPENIDNSNEIIETTSSLTQRIEDVERNADLLKMKVRDLTLDYFNERLNDCEINLEREEENASKLTTTKVDLEITKEQKVLLKEGQKEYDHNQNTFEDVVQELNDKKISEFLSKEGFQGTLLEKCENISSRRKAVQKKLAESKIRIHRDFVARLTEKKRDVSRWLSASEKKEKAVKVEPISAIVPADEYKNLKVLEKDLDDGEPKYQETVELNEHLLDENVLEGRKATSSEKEVQAFKDRYATLRQRVDDKNNTLYSFLLNSAKTSMDEVQTKLTKAEENVNVRTLSADYPQTKQDFQDAQVVKQEVETVTSNSAASLKTVRGIIALGIFTEKDVKLINDRRNDLKDRNTKLSETADEKFVNFSKQYNVIIGNEVKSRKMWLDENESWLHIIDNDVDDLPGFEKKLEEQKNFDEELQRHKMADLIDEVENNQELQQDTKETIYEMDERWCTINEWSNERENKLTKVTSDWLSLREEQKELLDNLHAKEAKLKEVVTPIDLSNSEDTNNQRKELQNLQVEVQELDLQAIKVRKSSHALIKLVGVDTPAAKHIEKQMEDIDECQSTITNNTLTRIKKLDSSERKTQSLYHHMDTVNASMDKNANILAAFNQEIEEREEEMNTDEGIELEERDKNENETEERDERSRADLNNIVDQISLGLGDRPGEKARVERVNELKSDLEENLSEEAKNVLNTQVETFDNRFEELSKNLDGAVEHNEITEIISKPQVKALEIDVQSAPPGDDTNYGTWQESVEDVSESMKRSQDALQIHIVDVSDYPCLKKTEMETQEIIVKMNTEYKPTLMTVRTSGEIISLRDDVEGGDITKAVNSSQKDLEGLQGALELRKLRLRDSSIQHINERLRDCEAKVGEERVHLKLLSPPGKDLETVLDQLSVLDECKKTFSTNQKEFEEVQVHLNEMKQSKILSSPEFDDEFQENCKDVALQRALVLKQMRDNRTRIHRCVVNIFDTKRKDVAKWLKICEKKEKDVHGDAQDLDSALAALGKLEDVENSVEQGEKNYHETVDLSKTVSEHQLLQGKKATDAEHEITVSSQRYNQTLEDIQKKKNKLYKAVYQLLNNNLNGTEKEIEESEALVQSESQPENPTATHEELTKLRILVSSSEKLREDSSKTFDKANLVLLTDILPKEDKKEIRKRIIDLKKRVYDLPGDGRAKYDRVYKVYVSHLTTIIRQREEWIVTNEPLMKVETTDAADISELEKQIEINEDFENNLNKNNVRSVIDQIQDTDEIDPEVPVSELLGFEQRWVALNSWMENRKHMLRNTLENWKTFRDEDDTLRAFIDKKNDELQELDAPVNLADAKALEQRVEALKNLQFELAEHFPDVEHFDKSGETLLQNLTHDSNGAENVKKEVIDVRISWQKLELDAKQSVEKMEKSERTVQAIYTYMEVVRNWLDETDGRLGELSSSRRQLLGPEEIDGGGEPGEDEEPGKEKTVDEDKHELNEDEKETLREEIKEIRGNLKINLDDKDLNKARTERVHVLVKDIHGDVDEDSEKLLESEIKAIDERWQHVEKQLDHVDQDEKSPGSEVVSSVESTLESSPEPPLPSLEAVSEDATEKSEVERVPIEPYSGKVTLDLNEWTTVSLNLKNLFIRMQMNIRDIDSTNYVEMRDCELDTQLCIDAMKSYGRPCLNHVLTSGRGMLSSPEYSLEEKDQIRSTMEILSASGQFVHNHIEDQMQRLYRALVVYQNDQRKAIQRWLNSCAKKGKEVNEEAAGLEGSSAEYEKVQELKHSLAEGEPIFLHFKELSKRMINSKIIDGRKVSETEKDITVFTDTYNDLRALVDRKEKRLYTTVLKSISLPLESIEQSVNEAEIWVEPQDLSDDYVEAKEQFKKMKLSTFVIQTLNTRSGKVLTETATLVSSHEILMPEDKENIQQRIKDLSPRIEILPVGGFNKYKRMYREYLVLFEHEVEQREEWFEKNESKLTSSPVGDAKDLSDFLKQKEKHDEFVIELKRYDMSEFSKDSQGLSEINKRTRDKIRDLQKRWLVLSTWADERKVFVNSVISKWQLFRQHEITVLDFIDVKEKEIQELEEQADVTDSKESEHVDKLEKIQKEIQANSLEVWNMQRQCVVLVKSLGNDSEAGKHVQHQAADLGDHNEKLAKEIQVRINKHESARHKSNKLYEHMESVEVWVEPTGRLVGYFNDVLSELPTSEETAAEAKGETEDDKDSSTVEVKTDKQEIERVVEKANKIVYDIAVYRFMFSKYEARVERVNELQTELQSELDESSKATLDEKVDNLTEKWKDVNNGIDKVAWQRIPGIDSLQARTYQIHDSKVLNIEEVPSVESFDEWKEKVAELDQCLTEEETKIDPKKNIVKDYAIIQTLLSDVQECETRLIENCLPKLVQIRLSGVKLFKEQEDKQSESENQTDGDNGAMKSEISTTVLSLHERTQKLQSSIELQKLRLRDDVHEYLRARVRNDDMNVSHEQMEKKKLLISGEDLDTMTLHFDIIKEREKEFAANDKTFNETQEQFTQLNHNPVVEDKDLAHFTTERTKNIAIQRKTFWKLLVDIKQKLQRNIVNKYSDAKTVFTKWLKNIEKRERNINPNTDGVEKAFTECSKLKNVKGDIGEGDENFERLLKVSEEIHRVEIWDEGKTNESKAELEALGGRLKKLHSNIQDKQNTLFAQVKESTDGTLNSAETSVSEAETWIESSTLSEELEQATVGIQKSMEHVTHVNNMYTNINQSLKRPQEMAKSDVLPEEMRSQLDSRCRDLSKRMSRLPSAVFKNHKCLYEAFTALLQKVVSEREKWISENESHVEVSLVKVANLEDLKGKVEDNEKFVEEIANYNVELVLVELEKMGDPDFKLKATAKDLQSRWLAIESWAKQRNIVLRSMLEQWVNLREKLKTLIEWIDVKDVKLQELKEQVNLADEVEVKDELSNLKDMQTEMEDTSPEVAKLNKASEELIRILGVDSEAVTQLEGQMNEFNTCWENLRDEIQGRVRKLESSERQLSTMYRYMDQTDDWIDEMSEIVDQHGNNERRLQGMPVETKPTADVQTEAALDGVDAKAKEDEGVVQEKGEQDEQEALELDEDDKEKLRKENEDLVEAFVVKQRSGAKFQAFVDWAKELEEHVSEDLDDNSKESLSLKIEKFGSRWELFIQTLDAFSIKEAQEIEVVQRRLAEDESENLPESENFQNWQTDTEELEQWFETTKEKCNNQEPISKDSKCLKEGDKAVKSLLVELNENGQPRLNRVVVVGRRLLDAKNQTPEEEEEITVKITKLTKIMIEVERLTELQRIRTYETIVEYCKERLNQCETKVEHDEVNTSQLTSSGSTHETVHEQIVLLKVCEKEILENDKEFREINTYIYSTRDSSLISYETRREMERISGVLGNRRTVVYKLMRESHVRLFRTMITFFDQQKKAILKWITSCEKKEKQVKPDVTELRESRDEYVKVKDVRKEFDGGRQDYVVLVAIHKSVVADEILVGKKDTDAEQDMNLIAGRVERIDKILHDQETKLYHTLFMTLTQLLDSIENALSDARDRVNPAEIISTYFKTAKQQMEDTRVTVRHVATVHLETNKSIEQADEVKKAKLLGPEDADTMELRINDLTKKCSDVQASAIEKDCRMRAEYVTTFKTESQKCSQWITFLEIRLKKIDGEAEYLDGYKQLQEQHTLFEEDLKVYDLTVLLDEVDKIEELEDSEKLELKDLEKRWKKLLKWSEERKQKLFKIVSLWLKFQEEEIGIGVWFDEKNAKLNELDNQVDLTKEDDIVRQLDVLQGLRSETDAYAARVTDVESMGNELKRIAGDNTTAAGHITKQLSELDDGYNKILKEILQRIEKMESAQRRLTSMLGDMEVVTTWANETEVLLDEFEKKEKKLVDIDQEKNEPPKAASEQEEEKKKETKREKKERLDDEKAQVHEEMIVLVDKLAVKFDQLPGNKTKVERVHALGAELKEELVDDEPAKTDLDNQLQQFNDRWNTVSDRLKDLVNKDLPQSNDCSFMRFLRRRFFRAS